MKSKYDSIEKKIHFLIHFWVFRDGATSMIAKLQAMFDKDDYEKGYAVTTNNIPLEESMKNGEVIEMALRETIASGKVGSLTVDPQFLDFKALECELFSIDL